MRLNCNCLFIHGLIYMSLITLRKSSITYSPFDSYSNPTINSVYGTGNQLMDVTYRAYCTVKCNKPTSALYSDDYCCEGKTVSEIKCLTQSQCNKLKAKFQVYVLKITVLSYLVIGLVSSICSFVIIYWFTRDKSYKIKNSVFVSVMIISGAFIIPLMIIYMVGRYKGMTMSELFGANLNLISSYDFFEGVEIKENTKKKNNSNLHLNRNNNHFDSINEKGEIELKSN